MERKARNLAVRDAATVTGAAEAAGVTRRSIQCAIAAGDLQTYQTACGRARLLSLAEVRRWAPRPRGRPKA